MGRSAAVSSAPGSVSSLAASAPGSGWDSRTRGQLLRSRRAWGCPRQRGEQGQGRPAPHSGGRTRGTELRLPAGCVSPAWSAVGTLHLPLTRPHPGSHEKGRVWGCTCPHPRMTRLAHPVASQATGVLCRWTFVNCSMTRKPIGTPGTGVGAIAGGSRARRTLGVYFL